MNDFIKSIRFKILVAILMVMLGFMIAGVYTGGMAPLFSRAVSMITVPVQQLSTNISRNATDFFDMFLNYKAVYQENESLREEINGLRQQMADYETAKHENEQFREILGVKEQRQDLKFEIASVIAREASNPFYAFTIDKGSLGGVKPHDPVMTSEGLVGYVSEVGLNYAKVLTILNASVEEVNVGVYDSTTREIGIVTGTVDLAAEGRCVMEYLPRETEARPGNIVLTSGGSLYPRDIIVGTVETVEPSLHGTSMRAVIKPAADIPNIKDVFVITEFAGQGEED